MKSDRLDVHVRRFYDRAAAPRELVERLRAHADKSPTSDRGSPSMRRGRRVWRIAALAACLALATLLGAMMGERWARGRARESQLDAVPRIAAVRVHADWCGRCPLIAATYQELVESHKNEPLLFVTLDITTDAKRNQAQQLADALGVRRVFDKPFESGIIKVIDRQSQEVLAVMRDRDDLPGVERVLASAFGKEP